MNHSNTSQSNDAIKPDVLLFVYGDGGHRSEVKRLLNKLKATTIETPLSYISLGDGVLCKQALEHFPAIDIRDKYSRLNTASLLFKSLFQAMIQLRKIRQRYNVIGVVSTGPGIAIFPFLFFKCLGVKTLFLETFCRFETKSHTGRMMYWIADRFLVQNIELLKLYPKAEYCGRL